MDDNGLWQIKCFRGLGEEPTKWEGRWISLLTPEQLERMPEGTRLVTINGQERIVGKDNIDNDIRFGYLAYGIPVEEL